MEKTAFELLEIAESANAPKIIKEENWWQDVTFDAKDGWKVVIFYDGEGLDYIDSFITPEGNVIDFWEWQESEDKSILMSWRGNGDLKRLRESL